VEASPAYAVVLTRTARYFPNSGGCYNWAIADLQEVKALLYDLA
jgi:hypothetical protein